MVRIRSPRLWALLVVTVTVGAAACSSSSSSSSSTAAGATSSATSSASTAAKHYTIAYVPGATGVAFYDTLLAGKIGRASCRERV